MGVPSVTDRSKSVGRRSFLLCAAAAGVPPVLRSQARHCVFILMAGGPSQADMFDFQQGPWTPGSFMPATLRGRRFPRGLMPQIAEQLNCVSFLRGLRAPSTAHAEAQARLPALRSVGVSGLESIYGRACLAGASGPCGFEDACRAARERLRAASGGLRLQITMGGWDNHEDIYETALDARDAGSVARRFDAGLGELLAGLRTDGLLSETLVVAMGEFGRTNGPLNSRGGRDHHPYHAALVAGAEMPIDPAGFWA